MCTSTAKHTPNCSSTKVISLFLYCDSGFRGVDAGRQLSECAVHHLLQAEKLPGFQFAWHPHRANIPLRQVNLNVSGSLVGFSSSSSWWVRLQLWQPQRHINTQRSPLTLHCFVAHTLVHNSLISQLHRRPARNVLLRSPVCVCMCVKGEWLWTAGWASIWYTKNTISGWRAVWEIHTSQPHTERPEHSGILGSQLYYTWEWRGQAVRWEQHTQTQQQGGSNKVEPAQEQPEYIRAEALCANIHMWTCHFKENKKRTSINHVKTDGLFIVYNIWQPLVLPETKYLPPTHPPHKQYLIRAWQQISYVQTFHLAEKFPNIFSFKLCQSITEAGLLWLFPDLLLYTPILVYNQYCFDHLITTTQL